MKTFTAALIFVMMVFMGGRMAGQNLVGNGSFEDYVTCPIFISEIDYAIGWMSFQQSPDYYNSCSSSYYVTVPNNWMGPQYAATGNAYAGIITMQASGGVFVDVREYLASQLIQPLETGATYLVSFKANKAINDSFAINLATNHLGARFTSTLYSENQPLIPDNYSQIDESNIITDTANWVTVSGTFVADSNYEYIVIGNFYQDNQTDTLQLGPEPYGGGQAYYFIDDVSVTQQFGDGINEINSSIQLSPNPFTTHLQLHYTLTQPGELMVYDALGRKVKSCTLAANQKTFELSVAELPAGVYLVAVNSGGQVWGEKVVKE